MARVTFGLKFRQKFLLSLILCLSALWVAPGDDIPVMADPVSFALAAISTDGQAYEAKETPVAQSCQKAGGEMIITSLRTELLPLPLDYRVYLPPCYKQDFRRKYPVLLLVHGQSYTDDQWDRLGADETLDSLLAAGEISPFIIVMPRDRYGGQPTENNFARVVVEELFPLLEKRYRILDDRQYHAVGGLSRGAGWAIHLGIFYWQKFGIIGAHSPAVFHTDAQQMRTWLDKIPAGKHPMVYMDIGQRDRPEILESANWFERVLDEKDVPHQWRLFSGFHSEEYWRSHMKQYLRWYAKNW